MNIRKILLLFVCLTSVNMWAQQHFDANWASLDQREVPTWFENAKFGIFVHWGVYSVPAWAPNAKEVYTRYAEWYWHRIKEGTHEGIDFVKFHKQMYGEKTQYQDFAMHFKAELFDADQWAALFKRSGAKYIVLTSKHHEGFTLWPSAQSVNWNSVDIGPHRDICRELTDAVHRQNLKMGFYYSLYEWYHPIYQTDVHRYVAEHMLPQLKDLTIRYQPEIIWTDGEWAHPSSTWRSEEFLQWLYNESSVRQTVVVNDRWGSETRGKHGGFFTTEYDLVHEEKSTDMRFSRPWEECRGIGGSFGYNRGENIEDYSTAKQLIDVLIEKVSRGGNLLLNVGPTADGRIPVIMQERLLQIGKWLEVNGEAIYDTRQWHEKPQSNLPANVFFTVNGNTTYALLTKIGKQSFSVNNIKKPSRVTLLGYKKSIHWKWNGNGITIHIPEIAVDESPCNYAWVVKIQ